METARRTSLTSPLLVCLIVTTLFGNSGAAIAGVDQEVDWFKRSEDDLQKALAREHNVNKAKNVILFIGDGMGLSTVAAARIFHSQVRGLTLQDGQLVWEQFPHLALTKTHSTNDLSPDSAATATAMLCGVKTRTGLIAMPQDTVRGDCARQQQGHGLTSALIHAHREGKTTGVVSTARITHATPAAGYATSADRSWEVDSAVPDQHRHACKDIARQLVEDRDFIRVILGGGRASFLPHTSKDPERPAVNGTRLDGRNLMHEWYNMHVASSSAEKVKLVMNRTDFMAVDATAVDYLMGLFEPSHMMYEEDRTDPNLETWGEPSLAEMTEKAIKILRKNKQGFFLTVESGLIDMAHHDTNARRALSDTVAMADAVQVALQSTDAGETLVIVTADHSHSFTLSGYQVIDNNTDIFGLANDMEYQPYGPLNGLDGLPYTILGYTNGPGHRYHRTANGSLATATAVRRNLTQDVADGQAGQKDYVQDAGIPTRFETHSGEDVAVYASGPMAHLFQGTRDQSYIAHVMMYAACLGPYRGAKCHRPRHGPEPLTESSAACHMAALSVAGLTILATTVQMFACI